MHDNNRSEKRTKNEKQRHMRRYRISLILTISFGLTFIISATMLVLHYAQLAREDKALRELAAAIPDANITGNSTGNTTEKVFLPVILKFNFNQINRRPYWSGIGSCTSRTLIW